MSRNSCSKSTLHWAVPSWVIPDTLAANAAFLRGRVPGIGICFFETAACLAYGWDDLPHEEAVTASGGRLSWHIHLPLDLPWRNGAARVVAICRELCAKVAHLSPQVAVLHVPELAQPLELLARFAQLWDSEVNIVLENPPTWDVEILQLLAALPFGLCLDVAHALNYGQWQLLNSPLVEQAALWHWSAPGISDSHGPLTELTREEKMKARHLLQRASPEALHVLEIFDWANLTASLPVLEELAEYK